MVYTRGSKQKTNYYLYWRLNDKSMSFTINDITIIISIISLLFSFIATYYTYLSKSKIKILVGRRLVFSNTYLQIYNGKKWGGLAFIVPLTFFNWSSQGGSITKVRLVIGSPNNEKFFNILWTSFVSFKDGGSKWISDTLAHPIAIKGKSSVTKFIRFDWSPLKGDKIDIASGEYTIRIFVWTNSSDKKPHLKYIKNFFISNDAVNNYQQSVQNDYDMPIEIRLQGQTFPNQVMTLDEVRINYE